MGSFSNTTTLQSIFCFPNWSELFGRYSTQDSMCSILNFFIDHINTLTFLRADNWLWISCIYIFRCSQLWNLRCCVTVFVIYFSEKCLSVVSAGIPPLVSVMISVVIFEFPGSWILFFQSFFVNTWSWLDEMKLKIQ